MRVLDLGCGAGDVSLLAAELVGPGGAVLGIDRDARVVAVAEARVIEAGHSQVSFLVASDDALPDLGLFDAVIGRYVLILQKDPGVMIQRAASLLSPGGIIAFHEIGLHIIGHGHSLPEVPLFNQAAYWIHEVFRQSGAQISVGGRLVELFLGAGLPMPTLLCEAVVGGGSGSPLYDWTADILRRLMPRITELGIATAEEIGIETFRERLERAVVDAHSQIFTAPQFCAWTRKS